MNDLLPVIVITIVVLLLIVAVALYSSLNKPTDPAWKLQVKNELANLDRNPANIQKLIAYDKLLDYTFRSIRIPGTTMGERLKAAKGKFDTHTYNQIWEAHKLRNRLVHEVGINVPQRELENACANLRKATWHLV